MKLRTKSILALVSLAALVLAGRALRAQTSSVGAGAFQPAPVSKPQAPLLDVLPSVTRKTHVTVTGRAPNARYVEVTTTQGKFYGEVQARSGRFAVGVPLRVNTANFVHVTGLSAIGPSGFTRGPTTLVRLSNDLDAPELYVDGPTTGSFVSSPRVDVFGRVGDKLSGYQGLEVWVDDKPATVNIGIGTNGSFFLSGVPLRQTNPPEATEIRIFAEDAVGNRSGQSVWVTYVAPPAKSPTISIEAGNAQTGVVRRVLPKLLEVRLRDGNGQPFAGKTVTFDVVRNDGTLLPPVGGLPERMLQVQTDSNGIASARWVLGNEAGAGNHRVRARAKGFAGEALFCAVGRPGPAAFIHVTNMPRQVAGTNAVVPEPLKVWVHDGCNGVAGVPVLFRVVKGGGTVDSQRQVSVVSSATGNAEVRFRTGPYAGEQRVEASFPSLGKGKAIFVVRALDSTRATTSFTGRVLDNAGRPIGAAPVQLSVNNIAQPAVLTSDDGVFTFANITETGAAFLHIEAKLATKLDGKPIPVGTFPDLEFRPVVVGNAENTLAEAIRIPPLDPLSWRTVDNSQDVTLSVPGVPGLEFVVKKGSLSYKGVKASPANPIPVSINQVHYDEVPMPLPNGTALPFAWTLQPAGAVFDPPVEVRMPNMGGLAPGSLCYFLSFDHDTESFDIVATGAVSDDGAMMVSDPGTGISKAGWGGACPPYPNLGAMLRDICGDDIVDAAADRLKKSGRQSISVEEFVEELIKEGCGQGGGGGGGGGSPPDWSNDYTENNWHDAVGRQENADNIRANKPAPFRDPVGEQVPDWVGDDGEMSDDDGSFVAQNFGQDPQWLDGPIQAGTIPQLLERGWTPARIRDEHSSWVNNAMRGAIGTMRQRGRISPWVADAALEVAPAMSLHWNESLLAFAPVLRHRSKGALTQYPSLPAALTRAQLESPTLAARGTLRVTAPGGAFFLSVGPSASYQLTVRRTTDNADLTLGSSGTKYFISDGSQVYSVTSDGLLSVPFLSASLPNQARKLHVIVRNGSDFGVGQFALTDRDTDGDQIVDSYERLVGLNPLVPQGFDGDNDQDGLRDAHECVIGTNPNVPDTDRDGVNDGDEILQGSDPLDATDATPSVSSSFEVQVGAGRAVASLAGSWRVDNIPISLNPVRARLVGGSSQQRLYATSSYVDIIGNAGVVRANVLPVQRTPILDPIAIRTSADRTIFDEKGQRGQLRVLADYADNSSADVTLRARGTRYVSSNPNILNVSVSGGMTARNAGVAFLTTTNEGVTTTTPVFVSPDDELTSVEGFVLLADQSPVQDATVVIQPGGLRQQTDASGRFRFDGIPTKLGPISVSTYKSVGGTTLVGASDEIEAIEGGVSDAGILVLGRGIYWDSDSGGDWHDASRWSLRRVPGPDDIVVIERPTSTPTIWIRTPVSVRGIVNSERLYTTDGGVLECATPIEVGGTFDLYGTGTWKGLRLLPGGGSASVRSAGVLENMSIGSGLTILSKDVQIRGSLRVDGNLVIDDVVVTLQGARRIDGFGFITLQRFGTSVGTLQTTGGALTIGESLTVRGGGNLGNASEGLVIEGSVQASLGTLAIYGADWSCSGQLSVSGNSRLALETPGTATGSFSNPSGNLDVNAKLELGGQTVPLEGTVNNRTHVANGRLGGSGTLLCFNNSIVENLTVDGTLDTSGSAVVTIAGRGLTVNGRARLAPGQFSSPGARFVFSDGQLVDGSGEVVLASGGRGGTLDLANGAKVRFGPRVTIRGQGEVIGDSNALATIEGALDADVASTNLWVRCPWRCTGRLSASAGNLRMEGPGACTAELSGSPIYLSDVDFENASIRVGGSVYLSGKLSNASFSGPGTLISDDSSTTLPYAALENVVTNCDIDVATFRRLEISGLTLNATLRIRGGQSSLDTRLVFAGTQTLAGTGRVELPGASPYREIEVLGASAVVTTAPGIEIVGGGGEIRGGTIAVQGRLECSGPQNQFLRVTSPWTCSGVLAASNQGALLMQGDGALDTATIDVASGARIELRNCDFSAGATSLNGELEMRGAFANGSLLGSGSVRVTAESALDAMTLGVDVSWTTQLLRVRNGLTLAAARLRMQNGQSQSYCRLFFEDAQQSVSGTGSIEFVGTGPYKRIEGAAGSKATLAAGIDILAGYGRVQTVELEVLGDITCTGASAFLQFSSPWTHRGTMLASDGGRIDMRGSGVKTGALFESNSSEISLYDVDFESATIPVTGRVTLRGVWSNGTLEGSGDATVAQTAGLTAMVVKVPITWSARRLEVRGGLQLDSTLTMTGGTSTSWTSLYFVGSQSVSGSGEIRLPGTTSFKRIEANNASTTTRFGSGIEIVGGRYFVQGGSVEIDGLLEANESGQQATLSGAWLLRGTMRSSGGGLIQCNNDGVLAGGTIDRSATGDRITCRALDLSTGTATIHGVVRAVGTIQNGTLAGTGTLLLTGTSTARDLVLDAGMRFEGGVTLNVDRLTLNGSLTVRGSGTSGVSTLVPLGPQTIAGTGTLAFDGTSRVVALSGTSSTVTTIGAGVRVQCDGLVSLGSRALILDGSLEVLSGRAYQSSVSSVTSQNRGAIRVRAGELELGTTWTTAATAGWQVDAGATLDFNRASLDLGGTSLSNAGSMTGINIGLSNGSLTGSGSATSAGTSSLTSVALAHDWTNRGILNILGGLALDATLTSQFVSGGGGTTNFVGASDQAITGSGVFVLADGALSFGAFTLTQASTITIRGAGTLRSSSTSGVFHQDGPIECAVASKQLRISIRNYEIRAGASLAARAGGKVFVDSASSNTTSAGSVEVASGSEIESWHAWTQTAGTTSVDGALRFSQGSSRLRVQGGLLEGSGSVLGSVDLDAQLDVGALGTAGALAISGNLTCSSTASVFCELGGTTAGTNFDQLTVGGTATLAGTLDVSLLGSFVPALNDSFDVLTWATNSTSFDTINGLTLPGSKKLVPSYNAAALTLTTANQ